MNPNFTGSEIYVRNTVVYIYCEAGNLCLSVCDSYTLRTVFLIYFILGGFVAEHPGKCGVEFGAISTRNTFNINTF